MLAESVTWNGPPYDGSRLFSQWDVPFNMSTRTPCYRADSREAVYMHQIFQRLARRSNLLDLSQVYLTGESQGSSMALYLSSCAPQWQTALGGSSFNVRLPSPPRML